MLVNKSFEADLFRNIVKPAILLHEELTLYCASEEYRWRVVECKVLRMLGLKTNESRRMEKIR
jgi:hypothetical protein